MLNFSEFYSLKENFNQLVTLAKKHVEPGTGSNGDSSHDVYDYHLLLATLISPDNIFTKISTDEKYVTVYGKIKVNEEKERNMRPFLGMFAKMFYEERCYITTIRELVNYIMLHKQNIADLMLRNNQNGEYRRLGNILDIFKIKAEFNDGRPSYEILTDAINDKENDNRVYKWINSMPSGLKNEFKNPENFNLLNNCLSIYYTLTYAAKIETWNSFFGDGTRTGKISRYKSASDFLKDLNICLKNAGGDYTMSSIKEKIINTKGAKLLVYDEENSYLIADIWTWSASNKLGEANSWCISYNNNNTQWYSNNYMYPEQRHKMYFLWNFNLEQNNPMSKIGICATEDGRTLFAHDKKDTNIMSIINEYAKTWNINPEFLKTGISKEEETFKNRIYTLEKGANIITVRDYDMEKMEKFIEDISEYYKSGDITSNRVGDFICWIFSNEKIQQPALNNLISELIETLNLPFSQKEIFTDNLDIIERLLSSEKHINDIDYYFKDSKKSLINWLFDKFSIGTQFSKSILRFLKNKFIRIYNTILDKTWHTFKERALFTVEIEQFSEFLERSKTTKVEDPDFKYNFIIDNVFKYTQIEPVNMYNYFTILYGFFTEENVIKDYCDRGFLFYNFHPHDIIYDKNIKYLKVNNKKTLFKIFTGYVSMYNKIADSKEIQFNHLASYENMIEFFEINNEDLKDAFSLENKEYNKYDKYQDAPFYDYLRFMKNNGVLIDDLSIYIEVEKNGSRNIQTFIEHVGEKQAYSCFLKKQIQETGDGTSVLFLFEQIMFKLASEGDTDINFDKFLDSCYGIEKFMQAFYSHTTYDAENSLIIDEKNKWVWANLIKESKKEHLLLATKMVKLIFDSGFEDLIKESFDCIDYKGDSETIIKFFFKTQYKGIILDTLFERMDLSEYDLKEVGSYVKDASIINRLLNVSNYYSKKTIYNDLLYNILHSAYSPTNKNTSEIGDNEDTLQIIGTLIKKGYKIFFSDKKTDFNDCSGCFEYWNFYIIDKMLKRGYMVLNTLPKKAKEKIAIFSLEKNDINILKLLDENGIDYDISMINKNEWKKYDLNIECINFIIRNNKKEEDLTSYFFDNMKNLDSFNYFTNKYFIKLIEPVKTGLVQIILNDGSYNQTDIEKIKILLDIDFDFVKKTIEESYERNKRNKTYSTEMRNFIKNLIFPPKNKIKKIREMYNLSFKKLNSQL